MARNRFVVLLVIAVGWFPVTSGWAQTKAPQAVYLEFLAAVKKATSVDQIAPHLSSEFRTMLKGQPQEAAKWLQHRKSDAAAMTNFKVTKESISGDRCVLDATALDGSGRASTGKIELIREKGVWKVDEETWVTPH